MRTESQSGPVPTAMVKMLASLSISVTSSSDVEVALHFVQVQAPIDTTAIRLAMKARSLCPLCLLLAEGDNVVDMLLAETLFFVAQAFPPSIGNNSSVAVPPKLVHPLVVGPLCPSRRV